MADDEMADDERGKIPTHPDQLRAVLQEADALHANVAGIRGCLADLGDGELPPEVAARFDDIFDRLQQATIRLQYKIMTGPRLALVRRMKATARTELGSGMPVAEIRSMLEKLAEESLPGPDAAAFRRSLRRILEGFLADLAPGEED